MTESTKKSILNFYEHVYDVENTIINMDIFCKALATISLEHPKTKFIFLPAFERFNKTEVGNYAVKIGRAHV